MLDGDEEKQWKNLDMISIISWLTMKVVIAEIKKLIIYSNNEIDFELKKSNNIIVTGFNNKKMIYQ